MPLQLRHPVLEDAVAGREQVFKLHKSNVLGVVDNEFAKLFFAGEAVLVQHRDGTSDRAGPARATLSSIRSAGIRERAAAVDAKASALWAKSMPSPSHL